jgi:ATP-dependent DNA helicase RecQ
LDWTHQKVYDMLVALSKEQVIQYIPRKKTPFLTFVREREASSRIALTKESYDDRRERFISRIKSVLDYAQEENTCRSRVLLAYFGEKETKPCGKCDICLRNKETKVTTEDFETIQTAIHQILSDENLTLNSLVKKLSFKEPKVLQVVRFMIDNGQIVENEQMKLKLLQP